MKAITSWRNVKYELLICDVSISKLTIDCMMLSNKVEIAVNCPFNVGV